ncbi:MAG: HAD-IIB family hydrolase, partial [Bdellovibrionales bacterium]
MKPLAEFKNVNVQTVFCDIDDTITTDGKLTASAYASLWRLKSANINVVPVTGRPAGWCEMIARLWPVHGVIGENGGFYFRYRNKNMYRFFVQTEKQRLENRERLKVLEGKILKEVPGSAIASDQFCRLLDLAIDFCEDVSPLGDAEVERIVQIFKDAGANAKVSSIHVNGWFGDFDKLSMVQHYCKAELQIPWEEAQNTCVFIGDSPNDEPMFQGFNSSFAVANINKFIDSIKYKPTYV